MLLGLPEPINLDNSLFVENRSSFVGLIKELARHAKELEGRRIKLPLACNVPPKRFRFFAQVSRTRIKFCRIHYVGLPYSEK
jgi:hypothetical protein